MNSVAYTTNVMSDSKPGIFKRLYAAYRAHVEYKQMLVCLSAMEDHELWDIGIAPGDVGKACLEAAEKERNRVLFG